jgi:DNA-binding transcriptional LysR family regulator
LQPRYAKLQIMNWNDLRYLLAVCREGSLSAAGKKLGVNQTTVSRRLQCLEQSLGHPLLNRDGGRPVLTGIGRDIFRQAEAVEIRLIQMERQAMEPAEVAGPLTITAVESLISDCLMPKLPDLLSQYPNLQVTLLGCNDNLQVSRREADIAIRLTRPEKGHMLISKLCNMGFCIYGTKELASRAAAAGLTDIPWAAYDSSMTDLPEMRWLQNSYPNVRVVFRGNSAAVIETVLVQGLAVALLPCYLGDCNTELVRLSGAHPVLSREAWLLTPAETARSARLSAGTAWIRNTITSRRAQFEGLPATGY